MSHRTADLTRVLIPGACHPIARDTLESLQRAGDDGFHIVGVDVEERGRDFDGVDQYYVVPPADSPDYVETILRICRKERVEIVVPWSDDEVEAISSQASAFHESGIATLCGPHASVQCALDKGRTLEVLRERGVPVPDFELASAADELERAAKTLGYPGQVIVVKPRRASGGRGMWILDRDADMLQHRPGPGRSSTLPAFLFVVRESEGAGKSVPEYVVMPFLAGDDYSVDALADAGHVVFVVPRRRIKAVEGITHVAEIGPNPEVRSMVTRVIAALDLHLNVNVQLKYSVASGAPPLVYEVNPRISGSIVSNDGAGVSLLYYGIQLALGRPVPPRDSFLARETRMFREWVGRYTHKDRSFTP